MRKMEIPEEYKELYKLCFENKEILDKYDPPNLEGRSTKW